MTTAWFDLLSNSPARNAGVYLPAVPTDAFGTQRPQSPDPGAEQYGSGP
ncbi:MAG: choice-of-anchor Q domain-containing protein [Methylocella sp.]